MVKLFCMNIGANVTVDFILKIHFIFILGALHVMLIIYFNCKKKKKKG